MKRTYLRLTNFLAKVCHGGSAITAASMGSLASPDLDVNFEVNLMEVNITSVDV